MRCTLDSCRDSTFCEHTPQDGLCEDGEICLPAVGCIPSPPGSCSSAEDCEAGARCVGEWDCQDEFGCVFVSAVDCGDTDDCTVDGCDEDRGGCFHDPLDGDGDGHSPSSCPSGDDCDDADPMRHGAASEVCGNTVDEDCDAMIDEGCCTPGLACSTSCGSTGARECPSGACLPPGETCNGVDDDCDGMLDEGFECSGAATRSCPTGCGSTGVQTCSSCSFGPCIPPAEICNGADDDCDAAPDDGFACARSAVSPCSTLCGSTGTSTCAADCTPGACVPPAESCNGLDDDCAGGADDTFECVRGTSAPCTTLCGSTGTQTCRAGSCTYGTCTPPAEICNGVDEDCDGARDDGVGLCYRGETQPCSLHGFFAGTTACRNDCSSYDLSTCTNCGNGTRDAGEACDGTQLGGATCGSLGFAGGPLSCGAGCMYDTSACWRCGNMVREGSEPCDGSDLGTATCASRGFTGGGTLSCNAGCTFNTSMCIWSPTGTWVFSPAYNYNCAFGNVTLSFGNLTFTDTGTTLSVSGGGLNCTMTGASARVSRMVDVSCTQSGGCNETYRLTGTFTGDNAFSGMFRRRFVGPDCSGFGIDPCLDADTPVTATR